ncbi:MAG: PEP-CTERM sorting domain-containing protein [Planctomycetota bacterium]
MRSWVLVFVMGVCVVWMSTVSYALPYIADLLPFDENGDFVTIEGLDVSMVVSQLNGCVRFDIFNNSTISSAVEGVYFDNGSLLGIEYLIDSDDQGSGGEFGHPDVDFSLGAAPPDLPGGQNLVPPFETSNGCRYFSADSDPPTSPLAIQPGEWLGIEFELMSGQTFDNVILELLSGEDLRIGVHIISLPGDLSISAVNDIPVPIPEPATLLLLSFGLLVLRKRV